MEKSTKYFKITQQEYLLLVCFVKLFKVSDPNLPMSTNFSKSWKHWYSICISNHHDTYFRYLMILFINYTSIKLGGKRVNTDFFFFFNGTTGKTSRIRSLLDLGNHLANLLNAIHALSTLLGFLKICWENEHLEKWVPLRTKWRVLKVDCKGAHGRKKRQK